MAHGNIDSRRRNVKLALAGCRTITSAQRRALAEKYNCSDGAIRADVNLINLGKRNSKSDSIHVTPKLRAMVLCRDLGICQYCLEMSTGAMVVEHVVPASMGGRAKFHNLVLACQSCNVKKSDTVWIPNNLFHITNNELEWRQFVINNAIHNPTNISTTESKFDLHRELNDRMSLAESMWTSLHPTNHSDRSRFFEALLAELGDTPFNISVFLSPEVVRFAEETGLNLGEFVENAVRRTNAFKAWLKQAQQ